MSPTIFKIGKVRVMVRTDDHGNPHIHLVGPGCEAKIYLGTWDVERSHGFSKKDLKRAIKFLKTRLIDLTEAWSTIHGEPKRTKDEEE